MQGNPDSVVSEYLKTNATISNIPIIDRKDRLGSGKIIFKEITILDSKRKRINNIKTGEDIVFKIRFESIHSDMFQKNPLEIGVIIRDKFDSVVTTLSSFFTDESPVSVSNTSEVFCIVAKFPLLSGKYNVDLWCATSSEDHDFVSNAFTLVVEEGNYFNSKHTWRPRADRHGYFVTAQKWEHKK
jgi:lipopolysaccharide transport system ATP-binding protein